ncbi:MAG: penicillin-binding transpeptidase domain-containing protein, partial [Planctomycetota bacterium]|nr:penicillin-binding transpeptidase domain-containing protein [Planctomycetota bacterium]
LCEVGRIEQADLEERKSVITSRVQQIASYVWLNDQRKQLAELDEDAQPWRRVAQDIEEQRASHAMLTAVDDASLVRIQSLINAATATKADPELEVWGQVKIQSSRARDYPLDVMEVSLSRSGLPTPMRSDEPSVRYVEGVGVHVLGLMRNAWKQDLVDRPFVRDASVGGGTGPDLGGYQPGDRVGSWGVEKSQETWLRGLRGQVLAHLDTSEEERVEPIPGRDVTLTVDINLQARIQAIMDPAFGLTRVQEWHAKDPTVTPGDQPERPVLGDKLNGAAIVLDAATSQVLASVSVPALSLQKLRDDPDSVVKDRMNEPFVNRVVARAFQPGSIVKPLVLAAAITDRKFAPDATVTCNGFLDPNHPERFRCWIYRAFNQVHGPLTGPEAVQHSCNIFFYTMGERLGPQRLVWWYERYGLGRPLDCGLGEEIAGDLPDPASYRGSDTPGFRPAEAILMGIGQGPIRWTPIQAAAAYAALARGGKYIPPTYVLQPAPHPQAIDLGLDGRGVQEAMEGLSLVTSEGGTAHHLSFLPGREVIFNCPGVRVLGKSGTADASPLRIDGKIVREGAHGWFVGLVRKDGEAKPRYVVAVVVEYGGSGGNVAGPIANQIIYALRDEGYL